MKNKFEIRNSKFETNPKKKNSEVCLWCFGFRICSLFRISDFGFRIFTLFLLLSISNSTSAGFFDLSSPHTYGPLKTRTQNPLFLLFLSSSPEKAETLPRKDFSVELENTFSNLFERNQRAVGVGADLDMEILRTTFNAGYGLTNRLEVGVQIPFLSFSGGFMDAFIQGYHNAFGFPNAGREQVNNGRFSYLVTRNGAALYQVDQADFRLSDMVVWQKLKIFDETKTFPAMALKTSLKLPTGSAAQGTGSRRPDAGMSVLAQKSYKRLHSYTSLGFLVLGGHPNLNPILRKGAATFGQAFEINMTEHVSFVGQVSGSSPLFKNVSISQLSDPALDLTFGFTGEVPMKKTFKKIHYEAAFTEDPHHAGPSIDFSLYFKLAAEI